MENNSSLNWSANYGSCPNCGQGAPAITELPPSSAVGDIPGNPNLPTLEEIASYNYMNAYERRRQQQQLENMGRDLSPVPPSTGRYPAAPSLAPPRVLPFGSTPSSPSAQPQSTGTQNPEAPITPTTQPPPISAESLQYMNGFLRTQLGRPVRVEFLIGTNNMVDRMGILLAVGANYILISEVDTDDILLCDFYNIKFIRFYY